MDINHMIEDRHISKYRLAKNSGVPYMTINDICSGKANLADCNARTIYKLSKELGIRHYDLDELQWDNSSDSYGSKREPDERDRLLADVLNKSDWIIEGVYYAWCQQCFSDADKIYVLSVPRYKYRYRIIRRFVRRKLGLEQGKKEKNGLVNCSSIRPQTEKDRAAAVC